MSESQAEHIMNYMEANAELLAENKPTLKISLGDLIQAGKKRQANKSRK